MDFKKIWKFIISMEMMIILTFIFALSCGVATFIEDANGTETAWAVVYGARWFEIIQIFLGINLVGNIIRYKILQKKKIPLAMFHIGFIFILLGSGLTRYMGFEGILHIREGMAENKIFSLEPYIQIRAFKDGKKYEVKLKKLISKISDNSFDLTLDVDDKKAEMKFIQFIDNSKTKSLNAIATEVTFDGTTEKILMLGRGRGTKGLVVKKEIAGVNFEFEWGAYDVNLPFNVKLRDFQLERYPGSMSPSSYASEISIIDKKNGVNFDYRIFMNNTLDYGGFRFFQSSYDMDENGTVLSVNQDLGKWPTYIGYLLLGLGFFLNILNPYSRFRKLAKAIERDTVKKTVNSVMLMLVLIFGGGELKAEISQDELFKEAQKYSKSHSDKFGELLVQSRGGRIKPINTLAIEVLNKIYKKTSINGLNANQAFLGMFASPDIWNEIKIIKVFHPKLKKILGMGEDEKYASLAQFFAQNSRAPYKITKFVQVAHQKKAAQRNQFDKDVLKVDERASILYSILGGRMLNFVPKIKDKNNQWYDPMTALKTFPKMESELLRNLLLPYFKGLETGREKGDWSDADKALENIKEYQKRVSPTIIPPQKQIDMEILYNNLEVFKKLILIYLFAGLFLLFFIFYKMIKSNANINRFAKIVLTINIIAFTIHTAGLLLRWYISGHAPWSDSYESMLFIAWSLAFAGITFSKQSTIALALTSILTGITLFVAHLSFIDPQITTLVPVLKSYWLNIHVSVITASYGFLGLSSLLGFFTLVLFIIRKDSRKNIDSSIIEATRINEMSIILGLSLLTFGNFLGGVWANESWGRYWGWDPKETWAWISILVYAMVAHIRFIPKFARKYEYYFAFFSTIAYSSIIMTYFGVNFFLSGMHSYASGDPMPVPNFVYYSIGVVTLVTAIAFAKRDLKNKKVKK